MFIGRTGRLLACVSSKFFPGPRAFLLVLQALCSISGHKNEKRHPPRVEFDIHKCRSCLELLVPNSWDRDSRRDGCENALLFVNSLTHGEGSIAMSEPGVRELGRRLEALERINRETERNYRRWKRLGIGLLGCAAAVALAGAVEQKPATIEAREFVLRDDSGVMRASLTIRPDGTPGFGLFDKSGRVRLSFDLDAEGQAGLNLHDGSGTLRAAVAMRPDGTPGLALFGTKGQVRASLDVGRDGTSGVNVYDDAGTLRAAMAMRRTPRRPSACSMRRDACSARSRLATMPSRPALRARSDSPRKRVGPGQRVN